MSAVLSRRWPTPQLANSSSYGGARAELTIAHPSVCLIRNQADSPVEFFFVGDLPARRSGMSCWEQNRVGMCSAFVMDNPSLKKTSSRRWCRALLISTGAVLVATWLLRAHAARDWPVAMPPELMKPLALNPIDPSVWLSLREASEAMPSPAPDLHGNQLSPEKADPGVAKFDRPLALFERAIHGGEIEIPPGSLEATEKALASVGKLYDAWLLRARIRGERGDLVRQSQDLAALEGFVTKLSRTGLFAAMIGASIEAAVFRQASQLVESNDFSDAVQKPLADVFDSNLARPSNTPAAFASECWRFETTLRDLRHASSADFVGSLLMSSASKWFWNRVPASWLYDSDKTIRVMRKRCALSTSTLESGGLALPDSGSVAFSWGAPGRLIDNPVGRMAITSSFHSWQSHVAALFEMERAHAASLRGLRMALAIRHFIHDRHAIPSSLTELVGPYAPQALVSTRLNGSELDDLKWDASARTLKCIGAPPLSHSVPLTWTLPSP